LTIRSPGAGVAAKHAGSRVLWIGAASLSLHAGAGLAAATHTGAVAHASTIHADPAAAAALDAWAVIVTAVHASDAHHAEAIGDTRESGTRAAHHAVAVGANAPHAGIAAAAHRCIKIWSSHR
jgi:hypothetical protein